jgi:hypothetical protein
LLFRFPQTVQPALLKNEEFWQRQKALEIAADHETKATPVIDTLDLLALRKPRK